MLKFGFAIILVVLLFLASCGRSITYTNSGVLAKDLPYSVEITVTIYRTDDPLIFIRAYDIEVNQEKMEVTTKGKAFISNSSDPNSFAIKVEDAKFSVPLGGKITIWKDGTEWILQKY